MPVTIPKLTLVPHVATAEFGRVSAMVIDEATIMSPPAIPSTNLPIMSAQILSESYGKQPTIPIRFDRITLFLRPIFTIEPAKKLPIIRPNTAASFARATFLLPTHAYCAATT
jgi:hypothetical protein